MPFIISNPLDRVGLHFSVECSHGCNPQCQQEAEHHRYLHHKGVERVEVLGSRHIRYSFPRWKWPVEGRRPEKAGRGTVRWEVMGLKGKAAGSSAAAQGLEPGLPFPW